MKPCVVQVLLSVLRLQGRVPSVLRRQAADAVRAAMLERESDQGGRIGLPQDLAVAAVLLVQDGHCVESDGAVEALFEALLTRARERWRGNELLTALECAQAAASHAGPAARGGLLALATVVDRVACESVAALPADTVYKLVGGLEECRLRGSALAATFLATQRTL
jgi:hypothetical protein